MVNISIYPYGNANERQEANGTWAFTCQHGEDECKGNLVETCFINLVSFDQDKYMDFVITYEADLDKNSRDPYGTAQTLLQLNTPFLPQNIYSLYFSTLCARIK